MRFDSKKPVKTRDGRKARIICTDRKGSIGPILALIYNPESGEECVFSYHSQGIWGREPSDLDLVNIDEHLYIFLLRSPSGEIFCSPPWEDVQKVTRHYKTYPSNSVLGVLKYEVTPKGLKLVGDIKPELDKELK